MDEVGCGGEDKRGEGGAERRGELKGCGRGSEELQIVSCSKMREMIAGKKKVEVEG